MPAFGGMTATIAYNGFSFNERTQTIGMSARPHYDAAGRTVSYVVHSVTLRTIINTDSANLDTTMLAIRRLLLVPGRPFYYVSAGYGAMAINVTNIATDVAWGPKPQELSYRPLGVKAAELVWRCEVAIPECSNARTSGAIMEFNYSVSIDQDRAGYTTRTCQGYVAIPMTRPLDGGRRLRETADDYWEGILPDIPPGFRRDVKNRVLDETKARLTFQVVDSEVGPNYLPVGVVDCKASHTLETSGAGLVQWNGTITADYEIARNYSPPKAYEHFILLVRDRLRESNRLLAPIDNAAPGAVNIRPGRKGVIIPVGFSMTEPDIYGRPAARFSLRYLMTQPFKNILKASALWKPVDNDWNIWKASLRDSAFNPRGNVGMRFNAADDAIIDLCLNANSATMRTESAFPNDVRTLVGQDLNDDCPRLEDSWIEYEIWLETESTDAVMIHKPLADGPPGTGSAGSGYSGDVSAPADILQRRTTNTDYVFLCGRALRACYDIVQPRLTKVGNRLTELANREGQEYFRTWVVGRYGHTLIGAAWRQRYLVKREAGQAALSSTSVRAVGTPVAPREIRLTTWPQGNAEILTDDAEAFD